jgi:NAD(P)-dependent dehydrogenase (short-subunit alcohol dehydrogenase family)
MNTYILITGASSGIGKELAIQLSHTNNIILHGRDIGKLEQIKQQCSAGYHQLIWQQDLNDITEIEASLEQLLATHAISIQKFIHSAGYMKLAPLKVSGVDTLTRTLNTNVVSASLICKTLIKKSINKTALDGVVFISSNISNMGAKALSAYGASKGALDSLMRCLAVELAPAIRVNSVLPGAVRTEMTEHIFENDEVRNRMEATYPLGIGTTNDICKAVQFLLSDNSNWITGQQLTVDGGRTINISG